MHGRVVVRISLVYHWVDDHHQEKPDKVRRERADGLAENVRRVVYLAQYSARSANSSVKRQTDVNDSSYARRGRASEIGSVSSFVSS